jgi:hypothetical protein
MKILLLRVSNAPTETSISLVPVDVDMAGNDTTPGPVGQNIQKRCFASTSDPLSPHIRENDSPKGCGLLLTIKTVNVPGLTHPLMSLRI